MLRSYWRTLFAAVGLALIVTSGQAQEQTEQSDGTADEEEESAEPFSIPVSIVESQEAAEARERRERESSQREKDDLIAQQGMNAATQWMAKYALLQTLLVAIGTGALIWTLFLTRQANKAAWAAVDATVAVGRKQVRAYLGAESAGVEENEEGFYCYFVLKNFGQSPAEAIEVKMHAQYNITAEGAPTCTEKKPYGSGPCNHPRTLAPGATGRCAIFIDRTFVDRILADRPREIRFYFMADIWWFDVYGIDTEKDEQFTHVTACQRLGSWNNRQPVGEMDVKGSEPSGSWTPRH